MINRYKKTPISQYVIVGLILAGMILFGILSVQLLDAIPFVDYFALPWAAGRAWLLKGQNPYDPAIKQLAEDAIEGAGYLGRLPDVGILIHPLVNLIFFLPFSLVPFGISRAIWTVALGVCAGGVVHFSQRFTEWRIPGFEKILIFALFLLWFPSIYTILTGRLTLVLVFLMVYGLWSIKVGEYRRAGFLLGLLTGSLPLTIFFLILTILWSIARREWSFLIAFISGTAFLWVVFFLMRPSWLLEWLRTIVVMYQDLSWVQTPLMLVASLLPGIEDFLSIGLHGVFGLLLLVLWIRLFGKSPRVFMWNALMILVITFLFQVQISISGLLLIIPPLCLILRYASERWRLPGKLVGWGILALVSAGSWLLILPENRFLENSLMLPMTIGLPVFVLVGMVWVRYWAVRLTSLPQI